MTADNFHNVLDALFRHTPFRPFVVQLTDGQKFEVDHARAVVERDGTAVFLALGGIPIWFDHDSVLSIIGDTAGASA